MNEQRVPSGEEIETTEIKAWVRPQLARLSAGSAELDVNNAGPDGDGTFS